MRTVSVNFNGKDNVSKVIAKIQNELEGLQKVSAAMIKGFVAIGAGMGIAIKAASDFETSMQNVNTLLGDNTEHFNNLKSEIKAFASQSSKPLAELTEAMYDIVSAGIKQDQQMATLRNSEKLAVAGLGTVKEATDLVTSSMNAFGVDSQRAAEVLNMAVNKGKTTVAELSQGFGAVASSAKEMGVSYEEFVAITATGTTVGKKASQVWTEQKAIMTALAKPTAEMTDLYKKLGVQSGEELVTKSGSLRNALVKLEEASKGNAETFAKAMSSSEGYGLALQLLGQGSAAYADTMAGMGQAGEVLASAYEKQRETVSALAQQIMNQLNVALIDLGSAVLPTVKSALTGFGQAIQNLRTWWDGLTPATQSFITTLAGLVPVLMGTVLATTQVISAVKGLRLAMDFLSKNKLVIAIELIVAALVGLYYAYQTNLGGFRDFVNGALSDVAHAFTQLGIALETAGNWIAGWVNKGMAAFKQLEAAYADLQAILQPQSAALWRNAAEAARTEGAAFEEAAVKNFERVDNAAQVHFEAAKTHAEDKLALMRDSIEEKTGEAKDIAIEKWQEMVEENEQKFGEMTIGTTAQLKAQRDGADGSYTEMRDKIQEHLSTIVDVANSKGGETQAILSQHASIMAQNFGQKFRDLKLVGTKELNDFSKNVGTATNQAKSISTQNLAGMSRDGILQAVKMKQGITNNVNETKTNINSLKNAGSGAKSWGEHLVSNFASGIRGAIHLVTSAIQAVQEATGGIKFSKNKDIPTEIWGAHMVENFAMGIRESLPKVHKETQAIVELMRKNFGNDGEMMRLMSEWEKDKTIGEKFQQIYDKMLENADKINSEFEGLKDDYEKLNIEAGESLEKFKEKHIDTIDKITEKMTGLQEKITELDSSYIESTASMDKSVAEKVLDQEELVSKLQEQVAEQTANLAKIQQEADSAMKNAQEGSKSFTAKDTTKDQEKLKELQDQLSKESAALKSFMDNATGYEDELVEARRRAGLTAFERFMEDSENKRKEEEAKYLEKKKQLEQEVADLEAQKIAETQIYEQKIAEYEAATLAFQDMHNVFSQGLDGMAQDATDKIGQIKAQFESLKNTLGSIKNQDIKTPLINTSTPSIPSGPVYGFAQGAAKITRPTMAVLGEGQFNEAVVPLPNGSSIPVEFKNNDGAGGGKQVNITYTFGDINISKEVDAQRFLSEMKKSLVRDMQLQQLGSI